MHARLASPPAVPALDLYGPVHKGLRFALCDLLVRLGQASERDVAALSMTLDDFEGVLYLLRAHSAHEEHRLHTALDARRPGAAQQLAAAHGEMEQAMRELREFAAALGARPNAGLLRALYLRYSEFVGAQLAHMAEEERTAQPLFEALYSSEELLQLRAALLADIGPDEGVAFLRVMLAGADPALREVLLAQAAATVPPSVLSGMLTPAWRDRLDQRAAGG